MDDTPDEQHLLRRARAGHASLDHGGPFEKCRVWPCADLREAALATVDAEVARWYVRDGQLSEEPLDSKSERSLSLRARRIAVLEETGLRDPHPNFLKPPTDAQRTAFEALFRGDETADTAGADG